ncbi:MAG: hypothetical protein R2798_10700 [Chitinophagales bacterium]
MDSIRIFIKITFVIFCLGLLYYLISLKPGKREVNTLPTTQAPTNTSQQNTTAETSPPTNTNATPKVSETPLSSEANKNFGHKDGMRIFIQNKRFKKDGMMGQYEGPIIAGLPDGYGIFRYDNGDFFVGRYESGLRVDWGMSCLAKPAK